MADVSAIINFHGEDLIARPAIDSYLLCTEKARSLGHEVERVAILDRPTDCTKQLVDSYSDHFDILEVVDEGDLGGSRNHGRAISAGRYLCFFDGDDLWGSDWLHLALAAAEAEGENIVVFHPEYVYYFDREDYSLYTHGLSPSPEAKSFFLLHKDSSDPDFRNWRIRYNNLWTSNILCNRNAYDMVDYVSVDQRSGFGVEDWTWNAQTLYSGVRHAVVANTVHLVRVKTDGSLGALNGTRKLLPALHSLDPLPNELM